MVGITSVDVKESLDDLCEQLRQAKTPTAKERLQVLYWLKQDPAPSISAIAQAIGKHRNTLQAWLSLYQQGGVEAMLVVKKSPGRVRVIPQWAETALSKRLQDPDHGFSSYGKVQQWLSEHLGVEADYHTVYQMTRYRLKAKLKVARPQNCRQDRPAREAFKQTSKPTLSC
ncbi:helix-turn-helix domain-containing protein [Microcoleus sp. herbarium8]|uniref:helix-turn-helix domain-containing protein n=1 Tax=Microcoleus sp. herbarium8 TaxID=3055436 RepID=UPI002FD15B20